MSKSLKHAVVAPARVDGICARMPRNSLEGHAEVDHRRRNSLYTVVRLKVRYLDRNSPSEARLCALSTSIGELGRAN